jgi:hypothetical protein
MTPFELADKLNGAYNANKVRAVVDGQVQVVGVFVGDTFELTDVGRRAVNQAAAEVVEVKPAKPRKAKTTAAEPTAIELDDVQLTDE